MRHSLYYVILGAVIAVSDHSSAAAQNFGDADKGHRFAREVCASCHSIEKGALHSVEPFAPTFETIAKTPGMNERALSIFMRTPHPTMPNLVLSDDEIADVFAYITSLKEDR